MELDAIAAVAVGGTLLTGGRANVLGTLLGACVIQLVRYTLLANGVPDAAALIVKAGLIVLAVFIQQRAERGCAMSSASSRLAFLGPLAPRSNIDLARLGVVAALIALIVFGALRYDNFLSPYNALTFLRYNSMFALIALGMALVIMTGGIDLSVGGTAAMASVVAALLSPYHWAAGLLGRLGGRLAVGLHQRHRHHAAAGSSPSSPRLPTMLAAYGTACCSPATSRCRSPTTAASPMIGQDDFLGFPIPAWIALAAYVAGWVVLERHRSAGASSRSATARRPPRLMGLKVERTLMGVYIDLGPARRARGRDPRRAVRRRPADRGRGLGALRHRLGGGRRHAAHRRRRLGRRDARRRAAAGHGLQHPQFRERPGLDFAVGLLAIGHPRPVPARRRHPAGQDRRQPRATVICDDCRILPASLFSSPAPVKASGWRSPDSGGDARRDRHRHQPHRRGPGGSVRRHRRSRHRRPDLADAEATRRAAREALPADLLVNCAGYDDLSISFVDVSVESFDTLIAVNARAPYDRRPR